ncbi:non-functional pseudokinase ZED1-like [Pistacia vera]|uniref:non-functional pseudokinase ZED1-like n=1 Tax=Pistacia vera TaxID=55513 RepID=UPI001263C3BF|nr:non-functional pseudokinase ZED1-like [Pistacia vera]XP_031253808.1 non-functional pseudokinase ZED1-like [Pistacia vera]
MMSWFLKESKRQKEEKRQRGERFLLNGKTLLKELIASSNGKYNQYRSFTDKEIKIATNNYDQQNIILTQGWYSLYSGFLQDRLVSVLNFSDKCTKYSINSIVFASQMRHKFFLKLIGCCLETEAPILVFEHVEYGTLADRIYRSSEQHFEPLLLTHRLKIAMEIANAIAYLHFGFSRPIIFRSIKPNNIVFTEQYVAKLFDFSNSIAIPEGETHLEDSSMVGTYGFMAPEYAITRKCNEKVDVYSFGRILLVLLTGLKSHQPSSWPTETHFDGPLERDDSPIRPTEYHFDGPLERVVKKYIEQERFTELVDPIVVGSGLSLEKEEQLQAFAELAFKCLSHSAVDRPTMIDVAKQLRHIYKSTCQLMS